MSEEKKKTASSLRKVVKHLIPDDTLPIAEGIHVYSEEEEKPQDGGNGRLRVLYPDGRHLLCKYNPHTREIEIKVPVGRSSDGGAIFGINVDELKSFGLRNVILDNPVWEFRARLIE